MTLHNPVIFCNTILGKETIRMKYVKKPIVVEAFQFGVDIVPDWFLEFTNIHLNFDGTPAFVEISTLEFDMIANNGDMIIKGIQGEIYSCKKDIFDATYEKVQE